MGGLFGGGSTISNTEERLNGFRLNSSCYGGAIPIVFGTTRISGNIIDYLDFTAVPHTKREHSGKGGGGTTVETTTYTYTVAVAVALCEGRVQIGRIWVGKDVKQLSDLGLQPYYNTVWPYIIGKYDERAVTYKNITYCAGVSGLGSSDSLPSISFEIIGPEYTPADMLVKLMTDKVYGCGLSSQFIGDLSSFRQYCSAVDIRLAAAIADISESQGILGDIVKCTNSEFLWTNGQLTIQPYCEETVVGENMSYDPNIIIRYNLTDEDFLDKEDQDPVQVLRSISADAYNCVKVEFINAANEYNTDVAEAKDTADIELNGIREADTVSLHYIHDRDTATSIAYMLLRKNLYVRNHCKFTLPIKYCLLEVFDVVTITDLALGYDKRPFRILEITENEDGSSEYEAEECFLGVNYSNIAVENPNENIYEDMTNVGDVNTPILFTAPLALTGGGLEVWLAVSGKEKDWGGCQIWRSWDDTSYRYIASKSGPSITGRLVNAVSNAAAECIIDVSESHMPLYSVSAIDAANLASLCYLDGEFFTYETAELVAAEQYKLKNMTRGLYGSVKAAHDSNTRFAKLDSAIEKMSIMQTMTNQITYLKLTSFDPKGEHVQYLDTAKVYSFYISAPNIPQVQNIILTLSGKTAVIVDFIVQQSNEYLFSEVYYRLSGSSGEYIYGGMDRQRVVIQGLTEGATYLVKVLPVISGNLKGTLDTAKGKTIKLDDDPDKPEGAGIRLNGINTYITLPAAVLARKSVYTIELKFSTNQTTTETHEWQAPCIFGALNYGGNIIFIVNDNGRIIFGCPGGNVGTAMLADGFVHSIAIVSDGSTIKGYNEKIQFPNTMPARNLDNISMNFGVGKPQCNAYAACTIYEARFWNVARTPAQFGSFISENEEGLQAWYKCEETNGNILKDSSTNGFDGTIIGNTWD